MPTILTAQYPKGLGSNEEVLRKHLKDSKEYGKLSFDCYGDKEIKEAIDSVGKKANYSLWNRKPYLCLSNSEVFTWWWIPSIFTHGCSWFKKRRKSYKCFKKFRSNGSSSYKYRNNLI